MSVSESPDSQSKHHGLLGKRALEHDEDIRDTARCKRSELVQRWIEKKYFVKFGFSLCHSTLMHEIFEDTQA